MATLTGNDGQLVVNSIAVAAARNFSVEITSDTIEKTVMSNDSRQFLKGLSQWSGSADIYFDPADWSDDDSSTFNPTYGDGDSLVGASGVAVKFYIKQDASNDVVFYGDCIITGYTVNSSFDGMVEASISFQGTGKVTFSGTGSV